MKNKLGKIIRSLTSLILVALLIVSACAQERKGKNTVGKSEPATNKSVRTIPVEIPITNQIYIQARINNSEPMWFLLDTGATWTILDVDKAKELNIKTDNGTTLDLGQTNTVRTTFAKDARLDISGVEVAVEKLAVMPVKLKHAPQIVGLIGSELIKKFVVEFDYAAKTINLFDPKSYQYAGRGERLPIELIEEIPHITVKISKGDVNSLDAKLLLDTGAAQTVMLYAPFVEKNKLLETIEETSRLNAAGGLGGGSAVRRVRARTVKIGNVAFDNPIIYFSQGRGAADRRDGIIGNGLLNRFKMIIDYSRLQAILEPAEKISVPTDFDSFGFGFVRDGKVFKITEVYQPTMAGKAGLKPGDVLLAIDGKSVSNLSLSQVSQMFRSDGKTRNLTVKRGAETLEIKLESTKIE